MDTNSKQLFVHEDLDTAYVNLAALVRYLQARDFNGRIQVFLDEYEAHVTLRTGQAPQVSELNRTTGRTGEGEAALQRLLVRAREAGGRISVYEEGAVSQRQEAPSTTAPHAASVSDEAAATSTPIALHANATQHAQVASAPAIVSNADEPIVTAQPTNASPSDSTSLTGADQPSAPTSSSSATASASSAEDIEWQQLLLVSGELIRAVERAVTNAGADFPAVLRQARLALADDYPFLDPATQNFEYQPEDGTVQFRRAKPNASTYITGVCECLRGTVEQATAQMLMQGRRANVRELVARELMALARRRQPVLMHFRLNAQLERIANTRFM